MSLSIETNKDRILPVSCELTSVSKDAGLLVTSNNYNQTYEQELKDCIEILIKKPDDIETLVKKAKLLIRLNRLQKAVDCFDRVLAICPADFERFFFFYLLLNILKFFLSTYLYLKKY